MSDNPLLTPGATPAFDRVLPAHFEPAISAHLHEACDALDRIAAATPVQYDTTLGALELASAPLETAMGIIEHLESVANTPDLREAYNAILPRVSEFWSSLPLHAGLWRALLGLESSSEVEALSPTRRRLLAKTLDEFRRHGADLAPQQKQELLALDTELSQLTAKFNQNVLDATGAFERVETDVQKLTGLPPSALEAARASAETKGIQGFRFTLQAPSVTAVLTYADNASLREALWTAYNHRGTSEGHDNRALLGRILGLRKAKAQLLGYESFCDFVLEPRMAKSRARAREFVADLRHRTLPAFDRENQELYMFRKTLEGPAAAPLCPWDVAYYAEKQRRARYDFDEEQLREYFPFEATLEGLFRLSERLFSIRIERADELSRWDPSVRGYRIYDTEGLRGIFYVDPYPRENKGGGAWMHGLVPSMRGSAGLAVIVCNATPPTSTRPSLMTHREVETLFHEFGHLLHHCLSLVEERSLSGTRVCHDFVELPSQIMENWCWERAALDSFARHYETQQPLPEELFERLLRVRAFRAANAQMRQLGFAALDLALHSPDGPGPDDDVLAFAREQLEPYAAAELPKDYALVASFSHLFAHPVGYASGYYSYKWAEVLDADAFSLFAERGIFDGATGKAWREIILEAGDSADPLDLFVRFRGRAPDPSALLRRLELIPETAKPA